LAAQVSAAAPAAAATLASSRDRALVAQLLWLSGAAAAAEVDPKTAAADVEAAGLQLVSMSGQGGVPASTSRHGSLLLDTMGEDAENGDGDGMAPGMPPSAAGPHAAAQRALAHLPLPLLGGRGDAAAAPQAWHVPASAARPGKAKSPGAEVMGGQGDGSVLRHLLSHSAYDGTYAQHPGHQPGHRQALRAPFQARASLDELDGDGLAMGWDGTAAVSLARARRTARAESAADVLGAVGEAAQHAAQAAHKAVAKVANRNAAGKLVQAAAAASVAVAASVVSPMVMKAVRAATAPASPSKALPMPPTPTMPQHRAAPKHAHAEAAAAADTPTTQVGATAPTSSWVVADAPAGTVAAAGAQPVRFVAVCASPVLEAAVRARVGRGSDSGLVAFESYALRARVPREVAAEAGALYACLLPALIDFEAEHPRGRVAFTGRGVGGSLAVVLGLMAAARGLRASLLSPLAVAFDAPPVIAQLADAQDWGCDPCEGGAHPAAVQAAAGSGGECCVAEWGEMVADVAARGLLAELGLRSDAVLQVVTPRAPDTGAESSSSQQRATGVGSGSMGDYVAAVRALWAAALEGEDEHAAAAWAGAPGHEHSLVPPVTRMAHMAQQLLAQVSLPGSSSGAAGAAAEAPSQPGVLKLFRPIGRVVAL